MDRCSLRLQGCSLAVAAVVLFSLAVQITGISRGWASDAGSGKFIFILDGSGSMNGQIQGKPKIEVAKEALIGLINEVPEGVSVGLVAYGHRHKGDCSDVEELSPLSPVNKGELIGKIKSVTPKGMTPITFSIRKVAEGLKSVEEETTIVLVSDGEETCKGDPCALVKELKSSGVKLVLHVIGFDVTDREKEQLACLARAGGGSYFTARSAGELKLAARRAIEEKKPAAGELTLKAVRDGKPLRAFGIITRTEGGEGATEKLHELWLENGRSAFQLPPGLYDVSVENRDDPATPPITFPGVLMEPAGKIEKVADFSGGILSIRALRNGVPARAYCMVYKAGGEAGGERVTEGWARMEPGVFKLVPGAYEATVENREDANGPSVKLQGITIEAGKSTERVAEFSGGTLKMKAVRNGKPLRAYAIVYKAAGGDEENEKEKVAEGFTEPEGKVFNVTRGAYDVIVEDQEDAGKPTKAFEGVVIEAGKTEDRVADFSGGTLRVSAKRNGVPFSAFCRVLKADESADGVKKKVAQSWTRKDGAVLQLEPGVYDLVVENQEDAGKPVLTFAGITLESGKTVEKVAEFSGGTLKVTASRNGKPLSAFCVVFSSEGNERKQVARGMSREEGISFQLPPGVYDLFVENQADAGKPSVELKEIAVEAGKTVEKVAEFSGGGLMVKALRNGKPFSAFCAVFQSGEAKDRKKVAQSWTRQEGALFKLLPGVYDVEVEDQADAPKSRVEFTQISVEAGKSIEKVAEFSGGDLRVRAIRNGKPFSALCMVFGGGEGSERKQVTRGLTREEGVTFQLQPGAYSLVVEDSKSREKKEIKEATVEAGKSRTIDVQF